ncbi:MAG: dynamin family protein [Syntrophobacterales bacterium]|nr:dynamin family protein [Syntrophobacterales bacterium]
MMKDLSREVLICANEVKSVLSYLSNDGLLPDKELLLWKQHLEAVSDAVSEHRVRIAVVGAVKSGKSTLVNAFLGKDLLKRGPGLVTFCITRVQSSRGEKRGWVELKSWSEINNDITRVYKEFYHLRDDSFTYRDRIDIRDIEDRRLIKMLLDKVKTLQLPNRSLLDAQILLLDAYLSGYDFFSDTIELDSPVRRLFDEPSLLEHHIYTGSWNLWAFTKDVEILFPIPWIREGVEIADCQGTDSSNPLHFAMLQDYLTRCHGIIYVVQSRVGLREADLRMLEIIKDFGLMPVTVIVMNIDIGEHEDLSDFNRLLDRTKRELLWLGYDVPIFSLSALAEMVKAIQGEAKKSELERVALWKHSAPELYFQSENEFASLKEHLRINIVDSKTGDFLERCYRRVLFIAGEIWRNLRTYQEMLDLDIREISSVTKDLLMSEEMMKSTLNTFEKTLSELHTFLFESSKGMVSEFFDTASSLLMSEIVGAIENYRYRGGNNFGDLRQLIRELYGFYISVREEITRLIAEKVSSKIIEFSKKQEQYISEELEKAFRSFISIFKITFEGYRRMLSEIISLEMESALYNPSIPWKPSKDLYPPSIASFAREQTVGRATFLVKLGLGKAIETLSQFKDALGRRSGKRPRGRRSGNFWDETARLVKNEVKAEVEDIFEWYKDRYIREYLIPLIEDGLSWLVREVRLRTETSVVDFRKIIEMMSLKEEERLRRKRVFEGAARTLDSLLKSRVL